MNLKLKQYKQSIWLHVHQGISVKFFESYSQLLKFIKGCITTFVEPLIPHVNIGQNENFFIT